MKIIFKREDFNPYSKKNITRIIIMEVDVVIQTPRMFDAEIDEIYDNVLQFTSFASPDDSILVAFETEEIATAAMQEIFYNNILDLTRIKCDITRVDDAGMENITTEDFRDGIS